MKMIVQGVRGAVLIITLYAGALYAESPTAQAIQDSLISQFGKIEDYSVKVKVSIKMTGLRMSRKNIKLFYKAPDKVKVEADGFAIIPKIGLGGSPAQFLDMFGTIEVTGQEELDDKAHWVLTGSVIPDSLHLPFGQGDKLPEISMTIWVDAERWVISRVVTELDNQKVFTMENVYLEIEGVYLPDRTVIQMGFKGLEKWSIEDPMGGPLTDRKSFDKVAEEAGIDPHEKEFAGSIVMEFGKYKVNQGLKDKIFKKSDY